jgi:hypothetical protein
VYGGGGGGGIDSGTPGTGGSSIGGAGGVSSGAGSAGALNTGSGGGGGAYTTGNGGNGSAGVVIISYPSTFKDLSSIGGTLVHTKTTSGGNTIYKFTGGSGSIQW